MSTQRERKRPTLRVFNRAVMGAVGLFVALVLVAIWIANPSRPEPPELERIDLKVPKATPAAAALLRLLERRGPALLDGKDPVVQAGLEAMGRGRWLADPAAVLSALDGQRDPSLDEVRTAFLAQGCLPREAAPLEGEERYSFLVLVRGLRLLTLRSLATAQQGDAAGALRGALELLDRLVDLEQRCTPNLIEAMVLMSSVGVAARALGYPLAAGLEPALEREVWARFGRLAQRRSPLPDALRLEAGWLLETLPDMVRSAPSGDGDTPRSWPWYDEADTRRLFELTYRRLVWLAEQPPTSEAWTRRFPEEDYLDDLSGQARWLGIFRFNAVGKILAGIAAPAFRKYPLKWHQERCMLAAQGARWRHELEARGRRAAAQMAPPRNPFTGRPVQPEQGAVCAAPAKVRGGPKGQALLRLPPPLPAKAAE